MMSRTYRYTPLRQPVIDLSTEHVLLCQRASRYAREGIEPIATMKRIRAVQRKQNDLMREAKRGR
jgi:hypothetical protein